jgi:hypothetical protein
VNEHLFCLQEKLNSYLRFVESGEIIAIYPKAAGRHIVFDVVQKYPAPQEASWFFERALKAINGAGFGFCMKHTPAPPD